MECKITFLINCLMRTRFSFFSINNLARLRTIRPLLTQKSYFCTNKGSVMENIIATSTTASTSTLSSTVSVYTTTVTTPICLSQPEEIEDATKKDLLVTNPNIKKANLSKNALKRLKRNEKRITDRLEQQKEGVDGEVVKKKKEKLKRFIGVVETPDMTYQDILNQTDYYFENGLRKVHPYFYHFVTSAKGRWCGRKLVEVFQTEFQNYSEERIKDHIMKGRLTVRNKKIDADYVIQNGDIISNSVHRHELPVRDEPVGIIAETESLLVVNKPPSIPIHPCGRYRFNSLLYILAKDYGYRNLRVIHRLDRLTSGLLVMCKDDARTHELMESIKNRQVKKEYVAKVEGVFPSGPVECNQPIGDLCRKLGIYKVSPNGKESTTTFERISTDGKTSIVRCNPVTGRTHQIRIHLQYLGYPIANDPFYNGEVWGPEKGKNGIYGKSEEELIKDLCELHRTSFCIDTDRVGANRSVWQVADDHDIGDSAVDESESHEIPAKKIKLDENTVVNQQHSSGVESVPLECTKVSTDVPSHDSKYFVDDCEECYIRHIEPKPDRLCIYLHALTYEGPTWKYSTPMPEWAKYD